MKTIARFVTRPNSENPTGWDLGIMMPFVSSAGNVAQFKPNTIYEIVEILDQRVIREVGECCISNTDELLRPGLSWACTFEYIIICLENVFLLTKNEFIKHMNTRSENDGENDE